MSDPAGRARVVRASPQVFGADEQDGVALDLLRWVRLARLVLREERVPPEVEVSVIFVEEEAMADLNRRFLEIDGPTDVLAFPLDDDLAPAGRYPDEGGRGPGGPDEPNEMPIVLGDVVVCPAVARRNAEERARSLDDELGLLVVHGLLHLLDYDHAEPAETERMQRRERELLGRFAEIDTPGTGDA